MKSISIFNNKGGVGKTTLSFHLAHALQSMEKRVLMVDLDPQCNMTLYCLGQQKISEIWDPEEDFISDYEHSAKEKTDDDIEKISSSPRSLHYYLKPAEDGISGLIQSDPVPYRIERNLHLIPGRLSFHSFEERLVENWNGIMNELPNSIRLATSIRDLISRLDSKYNYDFVIVDTSPSLGRLNRLIISTSDFFIIPCMPDMFSLYGIKNIGGALSEWHHEYEKFRTTLKAYNIGKFPERPAQFAGFVIFNAKKRSDAKNSWGLTMAAYRYAKQIPEYIRNYIPQTSNEFDMSDQLPIGDTAIMHSHARMPSVSQNHHVPMWQVPEVTTTEDDDYTSVIGSQTRYRETYDKYRKFSEELIERISRLSR